MDTYSIEARSLGVAGIAGHNYWVLRDHHGKALAELHGLATDRDSGTAIPIGSDESKHSLRAWHYAHDAEYAASIGAKVDTTTYIAQDQPARTVATGTKDEVLGRWNAAAHAVQELNALDLNYPNYGFKVFAETINSNSAYRTFGELMDVPVHDFPGRVEPGIENRMLSPERIEKLKYTAPEQPTKIAAHQPSNNDSPSVDARLFANDPAHADHATYKKIHDWVAGTGNWSESEARNVSATLYRKQLDDPSIKQVDHVMGGMGKDGAQNVFATYSPTGTDGCIFRTHIDGRIAATQSADENLEHAELARQCKVQQTADNLTQLQAHETRMTMSAG